ncbi:hypothetical protein (plasmid) [Lactobacillus backii] [Lactiplantibacillus mudanjiangensis]|uniref:TetR/AcrR family transcriptional regulator n=1 Tax=Lactiplantibacillus mudanjiangensis TaxID=1296538 RepID=UPI00101566B9|nr:TetR/AcrR family transcriptional regulator [Lactiplantibacillus mudanjiangensis]VDG30813.1 hypothetical protein (plasmid) [Lactobacillus backii] [Lactiplantibacillus mudanjiangensis]
MADHRYQRTDNDIKRVFLASLQTTAFDQVSITQLTKSCLIDRSTFYAHYDSLYTLAQAVITDVISDLQTTLKTSLVKQHEPEFNHYQYFRDSLVRLFNDNNAKIILLRQINLGQNSFDAQCRRLFSDYYTQVFHLSADNFTIYLLVNLAMSDFDYILQHQRAPELAEIRSGLKGIERIFN